MKRISKTLRLSALLVALLPGTSRAFDVIDRNLTYVESRYMVLGVGLGFQDFARQSGFDGSMGFGFRISAAHNFNRFLAADLYYQLTTFRFSSPDPINPRALLNTRAAMNEECLRVLLFYPATVIQPYLSAGVGGYGFIGTNQETALSFPINLQLPVGAGVRSYIYKNRISLDFDFSYHFLFGENQDAQTLALLGIKRVSFDTYSLMASFMFHLY